MKKRFLIYGVAYAVLLLFVLVLQQVYPKLELHLLLNSCHTRIQDTFFTYYSMLAEGPLYALGLLPLFWKHIKLTLFYALNELTAGGLLQILKHTICMPRPISAFENCPDAILPIVDGINMHHGNSFPSGHSSTFFVFCTCCALFVAYRYAKKNCQQKYFTWVTLVLTMMALLTFAVLGAYSRVYLSQHFLSDVCMGSFIGFITPCLLFYFGRNKLLKDGKKKDSLKTLQ